MKKRVATIVVVDEKDRFLILRRSKSSTGSGFWNFPGGAIEDDETPAEGAVRELKEEADLDVEPDDAVFFGNLKRKYLDIDFFITDEFEGEVNINEESDAFEWINIDQLDDFLFVGGGRLSDEVVRDITEFIDKERD